MQELACCPTTFYDSCEPTIIEKAYNEARLRGEKQGFFPVLLTLEENIEISLLDQLGIEFGKKEASTRKRCWASMLLMALATPPSTAS